MTKPLPPHSLQHTDRAGEAARWTGALVTALTALFAYSLAACVGDEPTVADTTKDAEADVTTPGDAAAADANGPRDGAPTDAGVAFNPTKLAGLVLWLDAQDDATFTLGTTDIQGWRDKSTAGNDAVPIAGHSPIRISSAAIGKSVAHFSGDQALSVDDNTSLHFGTGALMVAVVANWSSAGGLVLKQDDTQTSKPGFAVLPTSSTEMCWAIDNTCHPFQNDAGTLSGAFHTYIGVRSSDGATEDFYVDGVQVIEYALDGTVDATNTRPLYIGADRAVTSTLSNAIAADIGEVIVYAGNGAADASRVAQIDSYLRTRWGF